MTYGPEVYLSIAYTIANIALSFALGQGLIVAWWVKTLSPDTTIKDLHHIWAYGTNLADILLAGRGFNLVALASLLVALAPINGPLLQRASVLEEHEKIENKTISIPMAQYVLPGYSGWITGRVLHPTMIREDFGKIVNEFTSRKDILFDNSGCVGTCKGNALGAGYAVSCNDDTVPFNVTPIIGKKIVSKTARAFSVSFQFSRSDRGNFTFTTLFLNKTLPGLEGSVNRTTCTLQPATINYQIIFTNNTLSLDPSGSWLTDRVEYFRPESDHKVTESSSTHGGLALYLHSTYGSIADITYEPDLGMQLAMNGSTVFGYIQGPDVPAISGVSTTFQSPTFDLLNNVREIAFRMALRLPTLDSASYFNSSGVVNQTEQGVWNISTTQLILVEQIGTEVVYKIQYVFLIIAVLLTFFATVAVLIIFKGWWYIGRNISFSPIEIARAFAAPSLTDSDPNAEVRTLLKQIGDKRVRYGAVTDGDAGGEGVVTTLRIDNVDKCEPPQNGQTFKRTTGSVLS